MQGKQSLNSQAQKIDTIDARQTLYPCSDPNLRKNYYKMRFIPIIALALTCTVHAQNLLRVPEDAWTKLLPDERKEIQERFLIEPISHNLFGKIIDNQGLDRSIQGSNAGSALGGSIASAAYIDNAFRPDGNFSAKEHLAAVIIGGVLGSALNRAPVSQFQFRYAIQDGRGGVSYHDAISQEPFRHPVGVCVLLPTVTLASNQELCSQTVEILRSTYLPGRTSRSPVISSRSIKDTERVSSQVAAQEDVRKEESSSKVLCKIGALSPVAASREKCESINGNIIE